MTMTMPGRLDRARRITTTGSGPRRKAARSADHFPSTSLSERLVAKPLSFAVRLEMGTKT